MFSLRNHCYAVNKEKENLKIYKQSAGIAKISALCVFAIGRVFRFRQRKTKEATRSVINANARREK